jgi:hypothetical protein
MICCRGNILWAFSGLDFPYILIIHRPPRARLILPYSRASPRQNSSIDPPPAQSISAWIKSTSTRAVRYPRASPRTTSTLPFMRRRMSWA